MSVSTPSTTTYTQNVTRVCDRKNITDTDIPIYVVNEPEQVLEMALNLHLLSNDTYKAWTNSRSVKELCKNSFQDFTANAMCTIHNILDYVSPVVQHFENYSTGQHSYFSNDSAILHLANMYDQVPNENQRDKETFHETFPSFSMLSNLAKDFQENEHLMKNPFLNFFTNTRGHLDKMATIINEKKEEIYNDYYMNNNIISYMYRVLKKYKGYFQSKFEDVKEEFYYLSNRHEKQPEVLHRSLDLYYGRARGGYFHGHSNLEFIDVYNKELSVDLKHNRIKYYLYKRKMNRYKNRMSNPSYHDRLDDIHHEFYDYDENFLYLDEHIHYNISKWGGFADAKFDICKIENIVNGTRFLIAWIFWKDEFNKTGCNMGIPRLPDTRKGCIYPEFYCSSKVTLKSLLFPVGFDFDNPHCEQYNTLMLWGRGLMYFVFTPLLGYQAYIHPTSFYTKLVYNATGKEGLAALPPNLIPCMVINGYIGLIFLLVFFVGVLVFALFGNFLYGVRKELDKTEDVYTYDQNGFVKMIQN